MSIDELEVWKQWKKNPTPENNKKLLDVVSPRIEYSIAKYQRSGIPESVLRTQAKKLALYQANSFDPKFGANLNTHVSVGLRKMTDFVDDQKNTVRVPNYLRNQIPVFMEERQKLKEDLGRDPNIIEISDRMKIGKNLAKKLETAIQRRELSDMGGEFDFSGKSMNKEEEDLIISFYYDLKDPVQKTVCEYTFGIMGKPKLKPKEIASKTNLHEQKVRRMQYDFATTIKKYM